MSNWTLPPCSTLIAGMTGSGKTTFALRYLLNVPAAARFVFDDQGQVAGRLGIRHASTSEELEAALADRWIVFNPHKMFAGQVAAGFCFFCQWSFECSKRGPGKKIFFADEIWRHCTPQAIPRELASLAQMGRAENLELVTATQIPHKIHASIAGASTELVCFRLAEPLALAKVRELGADSIEIQGLNLGSFVSINRLSRGRLAGRVF